MKTRCIIVDDEPIATKVIKNHLGNFNDIEIVAECKNAIQAFEIIKQKNIDLIFLDIQMPRITGMDFLRSLNNPPKVIITTAYRNYAVESYELDVIDYLLKPISLERFVMAIDKYYQQNNKDNIQMGNTAKLDEELFVYVKENKKIKKVFLSDIIYIESLREYVKIHVGEKSIVTKSPISQFEEKLPKDQFIRIHKSFIVSIPKINAFDSSSIGLGDTELPIGRTYKNQVLSALQFNKDLL
jgi:two-component system, LytTR family, response regulator